VEPRLAIKDLLASLEDSPSAPIVKDIEEHLCLLVRQSYALCVPAIAKEASALVGHDDLPPDALNAASLALREALVGNFHSSLTALLGKEPCLPSILSEIAEDKILALQDGLLCRIVRKRQEKLLKSQQLRPTLLYSQASGGKELAELWQEESKSRESVSRLRELASQEAATWLGSLRQSLVVTEHVHELACEERRLEETQELIRERREQRDEGIRKFRAGLDAAFACEPELLEEFARLPVFERLLKTLGRLALRANNDLLLRVAQDKDYLGKLLAQLGAGEIEAAEFEQIPLVDSSLNQELAEALRCEAEQGLLEAELLLADSQLESRFRGSLSDWFHSDELLLALLLKSMTEKAHPRSLEAEGGDSVCSPARNRVIFENLARQLFWGQRNKQKLLVNAVDAHLVQMLMPRPERFRPITKEA